MNPDTKDLLLALFKIWCWIATLGQQQHKGMHIVSTNSLSIVASPFQQTLLTGRIWRRNSFTFKSVRRIQPDAEVPSQKRCLLRMQIMHAIWIKSQLHLSLLTGLLFAEWQGFELQNTPRLLKTRLMSSNTPPKIELLKHLFLWIGISTTRKDVW